MWKLWDELKVEYATFSFLQGWGLGVLKKSREIEFNSQFLNNLFSADAHQENLIRAYYRQAAELVIFKSKYEETKSQLSELTEAKQDTDRQIAKLKEEYRDQLDYGLAVPILRKNLEEAYEKVNYYQAELAMMRDTWLNAPRIKHAWKKFRRLAHISECSSSA